VEGARVAEQTALGVAASRPGAEGSYGGDRGAPALDAEGALLESVGPTEALRGGRGSPRGEGRTGSDPEKACGARCGSDASRFARRAARARAAGAAPRKMGRRAGGSFWPIGRRRRDRRRRRARSRPHFWRHQDRARGGDVPAGAARSQWAWPRGLSSQVAHRAGATRGQRGVLGGGRGGRKSADRSGEDAPGGDSWQTEDGAISRPALAVKAHTGPVCPAGGVSGSTRNPRSGGRAGGGHGDGPVVEPGAAGRARAAGAGPAAEEGLARHSADQRSRRRPHNRRRGAVGGVRAAKQQREGRGCKGPAGAVQGARALTTLATRTLAVAAAESRNTAVRHGTTPGTPSNAAAGGRNTAVRRGTRSQTRCGRGQRSRGSRIRRLRREEPGPPARAGGSLPGVTVGPDPSRGGDEGGRPRRRARAFGGAAAGGAAMGARTPAPVALLLVRGGGGRGTAVVPSTSYTCVRRGRGRRGRGGGAHVGVCCPPLWRKGGERARRECPRRRAHAFGGAAAGGRGGVGGAR
jgi:hypothetical protein